MVSSAKNIKQFEIILQMIIILVSLFMQAWANHGVQVYFQFLV